MNITDFRDIHTHNLDAGCDSIINLPLHSPVPESGYYSVGIHPWDAASATEADIEEIERMAAHPRVMAIGETGLDKLRGGHIERQREVLERHIAISESVGKPLILHVVKAFPELIQLRRQLKPRQRWIIHGFRGRPELAGELLRHGFDISIGSRFNPAAAAIIPPDRLFHETD